MVRCLLKALAENWFNSNTTTTKFVDVSIEVTGVNEHTPMCSQPIYTAVISASTTGAILTLNCTDADNGVDGSLVYSISTSTHSNKFTISNLGVDLLCQPLFLLILTQRSTI